MSIDERPRYASRAGEKLAFALDHFKVAVEGLVCADLGCSTGGFTDCLLQRGAAKVYAIDTGYGVIDWKLRNDPRVVVMERVNAMHVALPELVDFISIDTSWTKQRLVVPHALTLLKPGGVILSLLKPHYEAEPQERVRGVVKDDAMDAVLGRVQAELAKAGAVVHGVVESPVRGGKGGNKEFIAYLTKAESTLDNKGIS